MGRSSASKALARGNPQNVLSAQSSLQILSDLCRQPLSAYAYDGSFWIAVREQLAATLYEYALGSSDGGPVTAGHTIEKLSQLTGTSSHLSKVRVWLIANAHEYIIHTICLQTDALVSLRLSPEEAIFLALAAGNMSFYRANTGLCSLKVNHQLAVNSA